MILAFLCGIVFVLFGAIMYKFPPKEINFLYGYKTPSSMKTQERWNFAQKYAAKRMFKIGVFLLIAFIFNKFFKINRSLDIMSQIVFTILCVIYLFVDVELAIKKKFIK